MRRLILVYNRRSSSFWRVEKEALAPARELKAWAIGKFEIAKTNVDDNAKRLARVLKDGDLVIAAGGDATATIVVNGVMLSKAKNVRVGAMPFGNFNDVARSLGSLKFEDIIKGDAQEVWPLECRVNGNHWRYGMCYFTAGMFAEACAVFDEPKVRARLKKKKRRHHLLFSLKTLVLWWLKRRKNEFLGDFVLGNSSEEYINCVRTTDYMAVNGKTVAKMMRGGKWYLQDDYFLSATGKLRHLPKIGWFMARSIVKRVPGVESDYDRLVFKTPTNLMLQAEGEYKRLENVRLIEVKKAEKPILAIMK